MKQKIASLIECVEKNVFYNIIISLSVLYYMNPFKPVELTSFERIIGDSVIAGNSYNDRIRNVYIYIAAFVFIYACVAFVIDKLKNDSIYFDAFENTTKFLSGVLLIYFINRFHTDMIIRESLILLEIQLTLVILLLCSVKIKNSGTSKEMLSAILIFSMSMAFFLNMLFSVHIRSKMLWGGGAPVGLYHVLFYVLLFGGLNIFVCKKTKLSKETISAILLIFSLMPLIYRLYVELYYILSGYGIILLYPTITGIAVVLVVISVLSMILYFKRHSFNIEKMITFASVMLLVSIIVISYMPNRVSILPWIEEWSIYEWGNTSSALDTFRYGRLPIAEYFPSHAMRDNISGLLYGALNRCKEGLMVAPYGKLDQVLGMVVIFLIIKNSYNTIFSLAFCALLPLHYYLGFRMPTLCFASIIVFWYIKDKNTVKSYIVYWTSLAFNLLYILDEGFALGVAAILLTLMLYFMGKLKIDLKKWLASGVFVGCIVLLYFVIGSVHSGVPIHIRLYQFLSASLGSNGIWAVRTIGDAEQFAFWWGYCFSNICTVVFLVIAIVIMWREGIGYLESGTAIFCIAALLNIPRTMVFHTLASNPGIVFLYFPWIIAFGTGMLYRYAKRRKNPWCFFSVFLGCVLVDCTAGGGELVPTGSIYKSAITTSSYFTIDNALNAEDNLSRFNYDEKLGEFVKKFEYLFDRLLDKDETFVDGANLTSLYAMTKRKNPSYLTQLPSGITNEFSQEMFIEEIEKADAPILILGQQQLGYTASMVGVSHPVRYYKVYEYFYQRYKPLVSIEGKYAVWCYQEEYDEYCGKIANILGSVYQPIMYGYDLESGVHNYYVGSLPYIWGNYDEKEAWGNKEIKPLRSMDDMWYDVGEIRAQKKQQGNYLMITADGYAESTDNLVNLAIVNAANGEPLYNYSFTSMEGKQRYLIRLSGDYFWYCDVPLAIVNANHDTFKIESMTIIEGD